MTNIDPIELEGNWAEGYALDIHTISSEYRGDRFDTTRTQLGELVYQLKYGGNLAVIGDMVRIASTFLTDEWGIATNLDYIVPVPPSNLNRRFQPVITIAIQLSKALNIPICNDSLVKIKKTDELKDIDDYRERTKILKNAFSISNNRLNGKDILLFDDLYRSGATLRVITEILYNQGRVNEVFVLTLTKTRINR